MKRIIASVMLAGIFGVIGANAASAAPVTVARKAGVVKVVPTEKERVVVLEKER